MISACNWHARGGPDRGRPACMCARHVVCLGGESPLRAATSGTDRLSKGAGREAGSEGSEGGRASTTGVQTRRTGTGYKAAAAGAIEHEIETPNTRSDCGAVNPAGAEPRTHNLPWEVCLGRPPGLPHRQRRGRARQKSAEAVVAAVTKRRGASPSSRRAKGRIF
jgi:hypothetical protein